MGLRFRKKKWEETPLGRMEDWSPSLREVVTVIMGAQFPALICWGEKLSLVYNDSCMPLVGGRSDLLGSPFLEHCPNIRETVEPLVTKALSGEPCHVKNMELSATFEKQPGQAWFDLYFSPLRDNTAEVGGVLCLCADKTQDIRRQQAVSKSKERYQSLFNSVDAGFCVIKVLFDENKRPVDYLFLETNPAFEKETGIKNANGKRRREISPELEEYWYQIFGNVALKQEPTRFQRAAKASNRFYDVYAFPLGGAERKKVAIIFRNISKRKETEQALYESEKHLRLATKAADMHLCEVDLMKGTLKWTNNIEHNVGFPMPETLAEARDLLHPQDEDEVMGVFEQVVECRKDFEIEYRIIDPVTNKEIWVYSAGATLADANGEYTRIVGVTKNITERKIAEIRERFLTRLGNKLQKVGDPDQIMEMTVELLAEHLNVDRCTYAEVEADENHLLILGDYIRNGMPAMGDKGVMSAFGEDALRLMRSNRPFIVDNIKRDDRITPEDEAAYRQNQIEALIAVPLHKDGKFVAKVAIHQRNPREWMPGEVEVVKAVTHDCWEAVERARLTRKLQRMNKTLEERVEKRTKALKIYQNQLRSLASELNKTEERERQRLASELHNNLGQMLAIGKMRLDTLSTTNLPEETGNEITGLTELLNDALVYTRELMSDLKPPPALDKENFTEVLIWVANKMKKHGLEVALEMGHDPRPLSEEVRTTLRRCVRELLFNVIKHAGVDEARVIISYHEKEIQVTVEDEGRGFSMEEENPTPTEEGGFGLFNIRERMNWLGGRLKITTTPGEGTTATLYAPLKEEFKLAVPGDKVKEADAGPAKAGTQKELWKKIKVLLVDDHEMMRKGLRKLIEEQKDLTIVAEASGGEEAVALVKQHSPDVIVMDVNLPDMDGIEATQKIALEWRDISIIGLSLYDSEEVARDMKNAGAAAYLTKTEAFESLCATIREVAEGRE